MTNDVTKMNPEKDYIDMLTLKSVLKAAREMKKNEKQISQMIGNNAMEKIEGETIDSISSTFDIMYSNDKRKMLYNGQKMSVSNVVRELFYSQDNETLSTILNTPNIPDDAKKIFTDLRISMPMIQPYCDLVTPMKNWSEELNLRWKIDELKSLSNQGKDEEYYERLTKDEYGEDSERTGRFLYLFNGKSVNDSQSLINNVYHGLKFAQMNKDKISESQSSL